MVSGFVRETHYFNPADIETGGQRPSGSRPGPGASDWSDTALLLAVNGDLIRHLPCQQPWPQPLLQRVHLWQDARDWQEALLSSSSGQTAGSFYRYFHQSLSFGISDDNHDEVCWVEILSLLAWPGEKLHCLCHSGLGRSEPRMSSRNVILMWTWTMRKSILQNLSLMTGVSQYYSSSSLLTRETRPVLVLTMIQDSDNYFAVNISQPCIWWPESAWAGRDLGSYKLTDPWLNIWIQTHDTLYCRDKNIQTTRQEASPGHSLMRLTLNRKHDNIYIQKPFVFWPFCHIKRYVSPSQPSQQQVRDRNNTTWTQQRHLKYTPNLFL